jgi:hypothetical protein
MLAATLLSDWVFTQHPRSVREVVSLLLDGIGLRYVLSAGTGRSRAVNPMVLPKKCGNEELIDRCFLMLNEDLPRDYAMEIIELLKANATTSEIEDKWLKAALALSADCCRWLDYGLNLGALSQVNLIDLERLLSKARQDSRTLTYVFRARRMDYCERSESTFNAVMRGILAGFIPASRTRRQASILELLSQSLDPHRYSVASQYRQPIPLSELWDKNPRRTFSALHSNEIQDMPSFSSAHSCLELVKVAEQESNRDAIEWATDLTPWESLIETSQSIWGPRWAHYYLANVAAGIKSSKETCVDFPDLLDHSKSLTRRVRYARLRAGSSSWWTKQMDLVTNEPDLMLVSLVLLTWSSASTLCSLSEQFGEVLGRLRVHNWYRLIRTVESSIASIQTDPTSSLLSFDLDSLPSVLTDRVATAFGLRAKIEDRNTFYNRYFAGYKGTDRVTLEFCQQEALDLRNIDQPSWSPDLELIQKSYSEGVISSDPVMRTFRRPGGSQAPLTIAETIAEHADRYPSYLVAYAEAMCRQAVSSRIVPVGLMAKQEDWFIDS